MTKGKWRAEVGEDKDLQKWRGNRNRDPRVLAVFIDIEVIKNYFNPVGYFEVGERNKSMQLDNIKVMDIENNQHILRPCGM